MLFYGRNLLPKEVNKSKNLFPFSKKGGKRGRDLLPKEVNKSQNLFPFGKKGEKRGGIPILLNSERLSPLLAI